MRSPQSRLLRNSGLSRLSSASLVLCFALACCVEGDGVAQVPLGATQVPRVPELSKGKLEAEAQLHVGLSLWPAWEGPYAAKKPIIFHWDLKNTTPIAVDGHFTLSIDNHPGNGTGLPIVQALAPGSQRTGDLTLSGLPAGSHSLVLQFLVPTGSTTIQHNPIYRSIGIASLDVSVVTVLAFVDADGDGLDDNFEHALLEHYRPYFRFSKPGWQERVQGEPDWDPYPPMDIADYLRHSHAGWAHGSLMTLFDPIIDRPIFQNGQFDKLLAMNTNSDDTCTNQTRNCISNIVVNKRKTNYAIEAIDLPDSQASMNTELATRNIGLYGHVVPYDQTSSQGKIHKYFRDTDVLDLDGGPKRFVKIEYWQFFPKNGGPAPHGGDWDTVQLLIDFGPRDLPCQRAISKFGQISSVFHYHHGDESRFDFRSCQEGPIAINNSGFARYSTLADQVELLRDTNGDFSHPVVYIEYATHEFWPGAGGSEAGAPGHAGDGASFLTNTPPNLGEVEAPLKEYPNASVLMQFNGFWGRCCPANLPPPGPALHSEWTYPSSSSVRWLLNGQVEP